jgi:hypothetical protein
MISSLKTYYRYHMPSFAKGLILAILLGSGVVVAQFSQPSASPVNNDVGIINVGGTKQVKSGNFWADAIVTDNPTGKICLGSDSNCKTSWSSSQTVGDCRLETTQVIAPSFFSQMGGLDPSGSQICEMMLTPESLAQGWISSGSNFTTRVASSDGQPPGVCVFTRLRCNGIAVASKPSVLYTSWPVANFSKSTYQCSDLTENESSGIVKIADPSTLPTGAGNDADFSNDGQLLAVAHDNTPFLSVYSIIGDTFTKLSNPSSLPTGNANGVDFSDDGAYVAVAHATSPFVSIFRRGASNTLTKLPNPSSLPTGIGYGVAFSQDKKYLVVSHATLPFITIYKRSGTHGEVFTKLPNPTTLPTGQANGVEFSADSKYLAVAHDTTPFVTVYEINGSDVFTKLADPTVKPAGNAKGVDWQADGIRFTVVNATTPYVRRYSVSAGTPSTFQEYPITIPSMAAITTRGGVSISSTTAPALLSQPTYIVAASESSPYINAYAIGWDIKAGETVSKLSNPTTLPTGAARGAAIAPSLKHFAVTTATSPYISIYRNILTDTLIDYPADPECSSWWDTTEGVIESTTIACSDGQDNDADGMVDYAPDGTGDTGCTASSDATE